MIDSLPPRSRGDRPAPRGGRRLATRAEVRRPADQAGDLRLDDRRPARPAWLSLAQVDAALPEVSPLDAEHVAVIAVEARPLQLDRPRQDRADGLVDPADFVECE